MLMLVSSSVSSKLSLVLHAKLGIVVPHQIQGKNSVFSKCIETKDSIEDGG